MVPYAPHPRRHGGPDLSWAADYPVPARLGRVGSREHVRDGNSQVIEPGVAIHAAGWPVTLTISSKSWS